MSVRYVLTEKAVMVGAAEVAETLGVSRNKAYEGVLYSGIYIFVVAPKVGKSFLMAQLGYHISSGIPLWDRAFMQGYVLYLAED